MDPDVRRRRRALGFLALVAAIAIVVAVVLGSGGGGTVRSRDAAAPGGLQHVDPAGDPGEAPATTTSGRAPAPAARPLAGRTVVIDPGHNGANGSHPGEINRQVDIGNGR